MKMTKMFTFDHLVTDGVYLYLVYLSTYSLRVLKPALPRNYKSSVNNFHFQLLKLFLMLIVAFALNGENTHASSIPADQPQAYRSTPQLVSYTSKIISEATVSHNTEFSKISDSKSLGHFSSSVSMRYTSIQDVDSIISVSSSIRSCSVNKETHLYSINTEPLSPAFNSDVELKTISSTKPSFNTPSNIRFQVTAMLTPYSSSLSSGATFFQGFKSIAQFLASSILPSAPTPSNDNRNEIRNRETPSISKFGLQSMLSRWTTIPISEPTAGSEYTSELFVSNTIKYRSDRNLNFSHYIFGPTSSSLPGSMISSSKIFTTIYIESVSFKVYTFLSARFEASFSKSKQSFLAFSSAVSSRMPSFESATSLFSVKDTYKEDFSYKSEISALTKVMLVSDSIDTSETIKPSYRLHESTYSKMVEYWKVDSSVAQSLLSSSSDILSVPQEIKTRVYTSDSDLVQNNASATKVRSIHYDPLQSLYIETNLTESLLGQFGHPRSETQGMSLGKTQKSLATTYGMKAPTNTFSGIVNSLEHSSKSFTERPSTMSYNISLAFALNTQTVYLIHAKVSKYPSLLPLNENAMHTDSSTTPLQSQELKTYFSGHTSKAKHIDSSFTVGLFSTKSSERIPVSGSLKPVISITNFITKYDSVVPFFTSAFMEHGPSYKSANKTLIPKYETVPGASILGSTTLRDIFYSSLQFSTPVNDISSTENFLPNSALLSAKSVVLPSSYVTKQSQSMLSNTSVAEDNVDMKYLTMSSSQESMYMTTTFATRMYLQTTQIVSSAIQNSLTYHSISNYLQKNNLPISIRGKEKSSLSIDSLAISSGYKESGSVPYFVITYLNVKNDVTPHVRTPSISNQTVGIESSYDRNTESVNNIGPKSSFQRSFTDTNDLKDLKISPTPGILTYESADFNTPYLTSNSFPSRMTEGSLNDRISLMTPDTSFTLKRKSENNQILVTSKTPNLGMYFSNISPEISLSSSRAAKDNFQDNVESFSPMQTKLHMSDFLIAFSGKSNLSPNYIFPSTEGLTPSLKVDLKSQGEISSSILEGNLLSSNLNLPAYKTTFVRTVYPSITHHSTEGIFHKSLTSIEKITIDPTVTMNAKEASFTRYKNSENNVADTSFLAYQWHSNSRVDLLFNQTFSNADPSFIDRNTKSVNNIGPKSSFQRSFTDNNDLKWLKISPTPGILTHESANFNTPYLTSNSFPSRMTEGRLNDRISLMTPETSFTLKRKSENNPILVTSKTPNLGMYFSNISPEISLSSSRAAKDNIQDNVESFSPMQTKLHMSDFLIAFSGKSNLSPNYIFPSTEGLTPSLKVDLKSQGEISSSILEGNLLSSNLNLPAYKTIFLSTVYLSITRYSTEGIFHKSLTGIEKITIDPTVTMKAKEASFTQDNNSENNVADTSFLTYQWHSNSRVDFLFNQTSSNADPSFIDRNTKSVNNIGPKSSFQRSFTDNNDLKGLKISPTPGILTYESAHFDTPYLTSNSFPSRMTEGRLNGRISLMTPETSFTLKPKSENNPILVTSKTPNLGMYFSNISPEISLSSSTKEDNFQDNVESFSPLQTKLHMSDFLIAFSGNSNLSPNYIFPSTEGLTQSSKVNLKSQGEISSSILEGNLLSSNLNLPAYKTTFLSTVYPSITHYSTEGIFHKSLTGIEKITIDPTVTMKVKGASFTQDKNSENHVADTSFLTYQWHSNSRIDLLFNQPFSNADPSSIASKSHQITSKVKQESSALQNVYLREQTRPQSSNYLNHFETSYRPVNTLSNLASSKLSKDSFDVSANSFQTSRVYYNAILSVPALPFSASINNLKNEKLSSALNGVGYVTITSSFIHFPLNSVVSNSAEDFFLNRSPHTYESSISSFDKQFSSFTSNNLQYFSMHDTSKPLSINNNPTQQKDNSDSISVALASDFLLVKSINFGNTLVKFVNLSPNFKLSSIISTFTKENYWSLKENNLHSSARIESLTDPYFKPQSSVHFGGSIEHLTSSLSVTIPKNSLLSGHSDDGFMFSKKISHTKYEEYSNLISTYLESLAYSEIKRTSLMMSLQLQESYSIEYYRVTGSASKLRMSEKASVLPSPYVASELETRKSLSEGNPLSIATKLITPTFYSPLTQVHLSHNHKMQSAPEQFSKLETGQITLTVMSPSKSFSTAVGDSPMKTMTKNILHHNSYSVQPTEAPFSFLSTKVSDKDQLISVTNLRKRTVNEISDTKILDSKLNYESAQMTFSTSNAYHLELFSSIKLSSVQNMNFPSMQKTEYIFEAISGVNLLSQTSMSQVYISEEATNYISSSYTANHLLPSETRPDLTIFSYKPHLYSSLFASYHQTSGDLEDILTDPSKYLDIPTKLGTSTSTEYPGLSFNLNQGTPFFVTSATSLSSYYRITTSLKNTKPNLMKSIQSSIVFNSNSPSPGSDIAGQVEDILTTTKFISLSMSKEKQTISSFYYQNINTINTIKSVEIPEIIHSFLILSSSGYDSNYLANSSLRLTNFPRPKTSSDDEKSQHLPYTKSHQSYKLQNSDWEISAHFTTAITKNIPPEKGIISKSAPAFNTLSATQSFHPSSKELADRITTLKVSSSTEKLGLERHTDVQPMQTSAVSFSPTMTTKLTTNEVIAGISQFSSLKTQTSSGSNICTTQMKIIAPSPSSTFATKLFSKTAMSTVPMLHSNAFMLPKNTVYDMRSSGDSFLVQKMHHSISPSDQIVATPSLTSFVSFHSISVVSLYFSQMSLIKEDSNQLTPGTTASIFPIFSEYSKGNFKSKALSVESVLMSTFRSEKYNRHSSTAMFPESVWDEHSTKDVVFSAYLQKTFRPTGVLFQDTFTTVSSKITTTIMDSSFRTTDSVALHGSALLTFKHSAYSSFIHKSHSVMHLAISSTRANEAQSMLPGLGDTKQKSIITINMPPTGTSNKVPVSSDDFHYIFSEGQEVFSASPTVFTSISKTIDPNPETQRDITMDQISFKTQQFIITAVSNSIDSSPTSANEMFTDTISLETSNMLRQLTTRYSLYPGLPSSLWLVGYPVLFTDMSKDYASSHLPNRETDQTLQVSQVGLPRTQNIAYSSKFMENFLRGISVSVSKTYSNTEDQASSLSESTVKIGSVISSKSSDSTYQIKKVTSVFNYAYSTPDTTSKKHPASTSGSHISSIASYQGKTSPSTVDISSLKSSISILQPSIKHSSIMKDHENGETIDSSASSSMETSTSVQSFGKNDFTTTLNSFPMSRMSDKIQYFPYSVPTFSIQQSINIKKYLISSALLSFGSKLEETIYTAYLGLHPHISNVFTSKLDSTMQLVFNRVHYSKRSLQSSNPELKSTDNAIVDIKSSTPSITDNVLESKMNVFTTNSFTLPSLQVKANVRNNAGSSTPFDLIIKSAFENADSFVSRTFRLQSTFFSTILHSVGRETISTWTHPSTVTSEKVMTVAREDSRTKYLSESGTFANKVIPRTSVSHTTSGLRQSVSAEYFHAKYSNPLSGMISPNSKLEHEMLSFPESHHIVSLDITKIAEMTPKSDSLVLLTSFSDLVKQGSESWIQEVERPWKTSSQMLIHSEHSLVSAGEKSHSTKLIGGSDNIISITLSHLPISFPSLNSKHSFLMSSFETNTDSTAPQQTDDGYRGSSNVPRIPSLTASGHSKINLLKISFISSELPPQMSSYHQNGVTSTRSTDYKVTEKTQSSRLIIVNRSSLSMFSLTMSQVTQIRDINERASIILYHTKSLLPAGSSAIYPKYLNSGEVQKSNTIMGKILAKSVISKLYRIFPSFQSHTASESTQTATQKLDATEYLNFHISSLPLPTQVVSTIFPSSSGKSNPPTVSNSILDIKFSIKSELPIHHFKSSPKQDIEVQVTGSASRTHYDQETSVVYEKPTTARIKSGKTAFSSPVMMLNDELKNVFKGTSVNNFTSNTASTANEYASQLRSQNKMNHVWQETSIIFTDALTMDTQMLLSSSSLLDTSVLPSKHLVVHHSMQNSIAQTSARHTLIASKSVPFHTTKTVSSEILQQLLLTSTKKNSLAEVDTAVKENQTNSISQTIGKEFSSDKISSGSSSETEKLENINSYKLSTSVKSAHSLFHNSALNRLTGSKNWKYLQMSSFSNDGQSLSHRSVQYANNGYHSVESVVKKIEHSSIPFQGPSTEVLEGDASNNHVLSTNVLTASTTDKDGSSTREKKTRIILLGVGDKSSANRFTSDCISSDKPDIIYSRMFSSSATFGYSLPHELSIAQIAPYESMKYSRITFFSRQSHFTPRGSIHLSESIPYSQKIEAREIISSHTSFGQPIISVKQDGAWVSSKRKTLSSKEHSIKSIYAFSFMQKPSETLSKHVQTILETPSLNLHYAKHLTKITEGNTPTKQHLSSLSVVARNGENHRHRSYSVNGIHNEYGSSRTNTEVLSGYMSISRSAGGRSKSFFGRDTSYMPGISNRGVNTIIITERTVPAESKSSFGVNNVRHSLVSASNYILKAMPSITPINQLLQISSAAKSSKYYSILHTSKQQNLHKTIENSFSVFKTSRTSSIESKVSDINLTTSHGRFAYLITSALILRRSSPVPNVNAALSLHTANWRVSSIIESKIFSSQGLPEDGFSSSASTNPEILVNGHWGEWSSWSDCSEKCSTGHRERSRECNNPAPRNNGQACAGLSIERVSCVVKYCQGLYLSEGGQQCSEFCQSVGLFCSPFVPTGNSDEAFLKAGVRCSPDETSKVWKNSYDPSFQTTNNKCFGYVMEPGKQTYCDAKDFNKKEIRRLCFCTETEQDEIFGPWTKWGGCSVTCGGGIQSRTRICLQKDCEGVTTTERNCNENSCPIHGGFTTWSSWSVCDRSCGGGKSIRARNCSNPSPQYGGLDCYGKNSTSRPCNSQKCPVNGKYTEWTAWMHCDKPCNSGRLRRYRFCTSPSPMYGGKPCKGQRIEEHPCNVHACPACSLMITNLRFNREWEKGMTIKSSDDYQNFLVQLEKNVLEVYKFDFNGTVKTIELHILRPGSIKATFTVNFTALDLFQIIFLQEGMDKDGYLGKMEILLSNVTLTPNNVPLLPPSNVSALSPSGTSVKVQWKAVPHQGQNGVIRGYIVFYKQCQSAGALERTATKNLHLTVFDLKAFTQYCFRVLSYNANGNGVASDQIKVTTMESAPSTPPLNVLAISLNSSSMTTSWDSIPLNLMNGNPLGYKVRFSTINFNGELLVSFIKTFIEITGLEAATTYFVEVCGVSSGGEGPCAWTESTTMPSIPTAAPSNVKVLDGRNHDRLFVQWDPIPPNHINGDLGGYKVLYSLLSDTAVVSQKSFKISTHPSVNSATLTDLLSGSVYSIEVLAYNEVGDGIKSKSLRGETCKCPAVIYTNYVTHEPYIFRDKNGDIQGVLKMILANITDSVCGTCLRSSNNGLSIIDFVNDGRNGWAQKASQKQVLDSIDKNVDLSFPVYGRDEWTTVGGYPYVPVAQHPGFVLVISRDGVSEQIDSMMQALVDIWPILLINTLLITLSGFCIWALEKQENPEEFPQTCWRGVLNGMYWAFITMGTHGYGDLTPRRISSRMFALLWIIVGLMTMAILSGALTSAITTINVQKQVNLYGTEIAAITDSAAYRVGIRRNAKVNTKGKYTTVEEVVNALRNKDVKGALVDMFSVATRKDIFRAEDLVAIKSIQHRAAYGFVLSGGLLSRREGIKDYVSNNKGAISKAIEESTPTLSVNKEVTESVSLFDAKSSFLQGALEVTGIALLLLVIAFASFHFYKKWNKVTGFSSLDDYDAQVHKIDSLSNEMIQTMRENLIIKMNKLQQHHLEELKDFYKRRYKEHKSWRYSLRFDKDLTWADNLEVILGSARIDYPNNIKRLSSTDESDVFNLSNNSTLPDVTC